MPVLFENLKTVSVYRKGGYMGTFVVGGILVVIVGLIIASMVKDKKNGKSVQCGGDCARCGGHCH